MNEFDLQLDDGSTLHRYDTGACPGCTVFWHHGTPNTEPPPAPLLPTRSPGHPLGLL